MTSAERLQVTQHSISLAQARRDRLMKMAREHSDPEWRPMVEVVVFASVRDARKANHELIALRRRERRLLNETQFSA